MTTGTSTRRKAAPAPVPGRVPLTFAAVKERIKRPRGIVPLVMDTEAAAEIEALGVLLERVRQQDEANGTSLAGDVARRLVEVEDAAFGSVAEFVLQAISHTAYQALRKEHPPTAEQVAEAEQAGRKAVFNADTFAPALVLAQLLAPEPPDSADWQEFWDDLSDGQANQLGEAAMTAQMQVLQLGSRSQTAAQVLRELGLTD